MIIGPLVNIEMRKANKRFAAAILLQRGKVLLAKRTAFRSNYPGIWDFVGGHCEAGESFERAMQRELPEEIGIRPTSFFLLLAVNRQPDFIMHLFLVTKWEGEVWNKDENEHAQIKWFTLQQAKQLDFINKAYLLALETVERYQMALPD
jgi:mutator protein MutT